MWQQSDLRTSVGVFQVGAWLRLTETTGNHRKPLRLRRGNPDQAPTSFVCNPQRSAGIHGKYRVAGDFDDDENGFFMLKIRMVVAMVAIMRAMFFVDTDNMSLLIVQAVALCLH